MLKLKLQYFGSLMWRTDSFEKTLMLGKIEGGRRKAWQRMRWMDGITTSMDIRVNSGSWWWTGRPGLLQPMESQKVGHDWATELHWKWKKVKCSVVSNSLHLLDCSLPGSSVYGIFQARILDWVATSFSRRSSQPRDWTWVSHILSRHFTIWATREVCTLIELNWTELMG